MFYLKVHGKAKFKVFDNTTQRLMALSCSSSLLPNDVESLASSILYPLSTSSCSATRWNSRRNPRFFSNFTTSRSAGFRWSLGTTRQSNTDAVIRAEPVLTDEMEALLQTMKWDSQGLVVAIAQHIDTGAILMQGFANRDAVSTTLASGKATFYSRSRSSLWTKGETSFNFINVVEVFMDCDRDSIIYLGKPNGPTCHTGAETCYFTPTSDICRNVQAKDPTYAKSTLFSLENTILRRKDELSDSANGLSAKPSWTKKLMMDQKLLCSKIREEADELCRTLEDDEGSARTTLEMADVLYHTMVLLAIQDVKLEDVLQILRARFSQSGIEEKSCRKNDLSVSQT